MIVNPFTRSDPSLDLFIKRGEELIRIVGRKELIYDKSNKASRYELGIEKGMFIHFQDGEALSYASYGNYEPIVVEYTNTNCK